MAATMDIYVRLAGHGRAVGVTVSPSYTVAQLKSQIYDALSLSRTSALALWYGPKPLEDKETLDHYNIKKEAMIKVEVTGTIADESASKSKAAPATTTTTETPVSSTGPSDPLTTLDENKRKDILDNFAAHAGASSAVEIVFSFDTTGSMYSCLEEVRRQLQQTISRLLKDIPKLRIGLIAHGDYCDQDSYPYVLTSLPFCSDTDKICQWVANVARTGGGDAPECYEWALRCARNFEWSPDAAKALVVIGDCAPHEAQYTDQHISWHEELDALIDAGIRVYGVQAMNQSEASAFYAELAQRSGGVHIHFSSFAIITEMFLAVCYRETGDQSKLTEYAAEVAAEGKMTNELSTVFAALTEKHRDDVAVQKSTGRRVAAAWWDFSLSTLQTPVYKLVEGRWVQYASSSRATPAAAVVMTSPVVSSPKPPYDSARLPGPLSASNRRKSRKAKSNSLGGAASLNIVVLGSSCVGKTALTQAFVTGVFQHFDEYESHSMGEDTPRRHIVVDGRSVMLEIFDVPARVEFARSSFIQNAHAILLVYSSIDRASFDALDGFWEECKAAFTEKGTAGVQMPPVLVVATKSELTDEKVVNREEVQERMARWGVSAPWVEISAKENAGLQETFTAIARLAMSTQMAAKVARKAKGGCLLC